MGRVSVLVFLGCMVLGAFGAYPRSEDIDEINQMTTTWKAGYNRYFHRMKPRVIRGLMGVLDMHTPFHDAMPRAQSEHLIMDIPDTFDARDAWPQCDSVIGDVRDQSACGSCWAVAAASAMSDRVCIASNGTKKVSLSADDLMSCCWFCGRGCNGGFPRMAWEYYKWEGMVTGSDNPQHQGCEPYPFPPCEHHINATHYKPCPSSIYPTPKCHHECQTNYTVSHKQDKHYASSVYSVSSSVDAIQKEIMTHGSVEAAFYVFSDFLSYKSGVYQHVKGGLEGGHAVRMIGWGVENGTDYWLVANSWNKDWGNQGYFKILRGSNECGIESGIMAGIPK